MFLNIWYVFHFHVIITKLTFIETKGIVKTYVRLRHKPLALLVSNLGPPANKRTVWSKSQQVLNIELFLCKHTTGFQSLTDFLPRWQVDAYHNTCFASVVVGLQPVFLIENLFSFVSIRTTIFPKDSVTRSDVDSRCELDDFAGPVENSPKDSGVSRSFRTDICSINSWSHSLSLRECWSYTFNNFLLALWDRRNEGDLLGSSKIDIVKSFIQLM